MLFGCKAAQKTPYLHCIIEHFKDNFKTIVRPVSDSKMMIKFLNHLL